MEPSAICVDRGIRVPALAADLEGERSTWKEPETVMAAIVLLVLLVIIPLASVVFGVDSRGLSDRPRGFGPLN